MTSSPVETPAQATPKTLDYMRSQFDALDQVVDRSHVLFPQYMQHRQKSQEIFTRMNEMFGIGQGQSEINFEMFKKKAEELQTLYEECVKIRGEMAYTSVRKVLGINKTEDMETSLINQLDAAFQDPVLSHPTEIKTPLEEQESIRERLAEICKEASISPVHLLEEGAIGYYQIDNKGQIIPYFQKLEKDLAYLEDAERALVSWAASFGAADIMIIRFVRRLKGGLQQIGNIDPQSKELYDWQQQSKVKHDWKPLRILLALTGGMFSVMGLGLAVAGKGFSPATGFWMAVAIGAARPDLLQGGDKAALESIQALDHKKIHYFLTEKDWQGDKGVEAFREVQQAAETGNSELFHSLKNAADVNQMQIGELLGTTKSAASTLLNSSKMTDQDRAQAVALFGRNYDDGQKEMIETALMWGGFGIAKARGM